MPSFGAIREDVRALRGVILAAGLQLVVSFAYILWISVKLNCGRRLVALHLCVVVPSLPTWGETMEVG